ncbi:DNA binding domain, excisionase family [Mycobacteroides abscessus subsp. abscessus]|uniref:excisionase family DNA-binding protein n=1 Tax=Mycobacteroides abscessus TaxID=36809 RepID=UPI00092817F1|nr:excisionase family DNA-binding protein [Mycobacteroides abscessus]MBN7327730.1 excisionase family DNA-binding protein [Mycobacteroides abscessus subsp. abscessus]SID62959.1 DNA binding domain, excisionase family [Mycobacteroides abscessus subsp. abscessus]SIE82538.1 DNA binding domain, excisionase family [Mycobacteroides abscessus subsp. abscessus]SIF73162.1 DNA binding domain, excisionase family [Mycobacteroides abscessus subsp. abscessus]SIF73384.1 DNA binding domain, excisionase family [
MASRSRTDWLTATEVGEVLGCTRQVVCRLIRAGQLTAEQSKPSSGSAYRIHRTWLNRYLEQAR